VDVPDQGTDPSRPDEPETVGALLAALRKDRGLSGVGLGRRVGISQSKLSKIENGTSAAKVSDVRKLAAALDASPEQVSRLVQLAEAVHARREPRGLVPPIAQSEIASMEARAAVIRSFGPAIPSGLMQTAGYASAVIADYTRPLKDFPGAGAVAPALTDRMRRQEILVDESKEFLFVLAETALLHRIAAPAVMLAQVERLRSAVERPNTVLRILRSDRTLDYPPTHEFELLDDQYAVVDTVTTTLVVRDRGELAVYRRVFEYFWEQATEEIGPILDRYARLYADLARPAD
jgi:transcriptional regulator with XRE-family HTH domain